MDAADKNRGSTVSLRMEQVWAFVAVGDDDEEGLIGMQTAVGWVPFVGADEVRVRQLRPYAVEIAANTGREVKLVRFRTRDDIEVLGANGGN